MTTAYIALGANLGEREKNIARSIELMRQTQGITVCALSSLIENPAVGGPAGSPPFLNGVAEIETSHDPSNLLARLLEIEKSLGRVRERKWEPRVIDLDILLYGEEIVELPELKIPHPLMQTRRFVMEPLAEIAPDVVHPILGRTAKQLLEELRKAEIL